jgi:uncharacterized SAM-binding protein YcdF (DUF218 family)
MAIGAARRRTWRIVGLSLLTVAGILALEIALNWRTTLSLLGGYLVSNDPPQRADLILVMGGDFWGPRVLKAAELGVRGYAPVVLISGPPYGGRPEGELAVEFLAVKGYPRRLFQVFGHNAPSTIGEAIALRGELERRGARRVIVVTSDYHSRRCQIVLRLFCPGIQFLSSPAYENFKAADWWTDPDAKQKFYSEWTKILGTVFVAFPRHEVASLETWIRGLVHGSAA